MKVYLDTCSLQRPLDAKNQLRILLESEAVLALIALCDSAQIELVSSEALLFETMRAVDVTRKEFALEVLQKAAHFIQVDANVQTRANALNRKGIGALDALHLALAEKAQVDYFCTCDDKFLKKAKLFCAAPMKAVSPITLIEEFEL